MKTVFSTVFDALSKESFMVDVGGVKEAMTAAVAKTKVTVRKAMGGAK